MILREVIIIFSVTHPFNVDSVKFDPQLWLITKNNIVNSIKENDLTPQISIFPNPVHDKLYVTLSRPITNSSLKLLDVTGRNVKEVSANGLKSIYMDISGIAKGNYVLYFSSEKFNISKKIIIK